MNVPKSWLPILDAELSKPYLSELETFLEAERNEHEIFPPEEDVFTALELTPFENTNVLLLGQDPYHDIEQAHGLCFSVPKGVKIPPSLRNIYKELHTDIGCPIPDHGYLASWAEQGVLMLNTVLTVRAHEANSHRKKGWEQFTDAVIRSVNDQRENVVFILWGKPAQAKLKLIDSTRHHVIESPHPSPLSARRGFFDSRPFSRTNAFLEQRGRPLIDWAPRD